MDEYITKEQYQKLSTQIHIEMELNKFNPEEVQELNIKLKELQKMLKKSLLQDLNKEKDSNTK